MYETLKNGANAYAMSGECQLFYKKHVKSDIIGSATEKRFKKTSTSEYTQSSRLTPQ